MQPASCSTWRLTTAAVSWVQLSHHRCCRLLSTECDSRNQLITILVGCFDNTCEYGVMPNSNGMHASFFLQWRYSCFVFFYFSSSFLLYATLFTLWIISAHRASSRGVWWGMFSWDVTEPAEIRFHQIWISHLTSIWIRMWMGIYRANYLQTVLPNELIRIRWLN